jgi:hypothetical protein
MGEELGISATIMIMDLEGVRLDDVPKFFLVTFPSESDFISGCGLD